MSDSINAADDYPAILMICAEARDKLRAAAKDKLKLKLNDSPAEKMSLPEKLVKQAKELVDKKKSIATETEYSIEALQSVDLSSGSLAILHIAISKLLWKFKEDELRSVFCQKEYFFDKMKDSKINPSDLASSIEFIDQEVIEKFKGNISLESIERELSEHIIHFSQKLSHTKASGGVFVKAARRSNLPYLFSGSIQETLKRNLPADIAMKNNASTAISIINSQDSKDKGTPLHAMLMQWYESKSQNEVECDFVDARLTQLMFPHKDGTYSVITPLTSGGILSLMNEKSYEKYKDENGKDLTRNVFGGAKLKLPIGGSNPVNVSLHTTKIQNAWLHKTPEQSAQIRRALSVAYRGFFVYFDKKMLKEYAQWLNDPKCFMNDRDTVLARNLEMKTSVIFKLISKVAEDVNSSIDDVEAAREVIQGKLDDGEFSNMGLIEVCILEGQFHEAGLTSLTNKIIQKLSMNTDDVPIFYSEQTRSRHQALIFDILKEKISFKNGV